MPSTCCCVPGCSNRGGLKFPSNVQLQKQWIIAIKRSDPCNKAKLWEPSVNSVVCHAHFSPTDFLEVNAYGETPLRRQRRPDAVPSIFPWTTKDTSLIRAVRLQARHGRKRTCTEALASVDIPYVVGEVVIEDTSACSDTSILSDSKSCSKTEVVEIKTCFTQTPRLPMFSVEKIANDDEAFLFYTGLATYRDFLYVLTCLGEAAYHLNYLYKPVTNFSIENQLLLTLMKLRQHKTNFELRVFFGISETTVANIWITWVNFMFRQWEELSCWPERDLVRYFCPSDFKRKYPTTRVIIDGTEIPIMKPKPPVAQQATYSTYKNRNTMKVLVGSTPGGLVSYVSPAYGGSASDRQIVERSAISVMCDPGDSIMADKGFNVQDIFATKDVTINLPTFFSKKNRMSNKTVMRDRKIASKRVHIERIIGLAKTFKILTAPLNSTETKLATEITSVCFMLCNLKKCIVHPSC